MAPEPPIDRLKLAVESILFVADEPVELGLLAGIAEAKPERVAEAVEEIAADCQGRGMRIQRTGSAVQMVTAPEAAPYGQEVLGIDADHRLSPAPLAPPP